MKRRKLIKTTRLGAAGAVSAATVSAPGFDVMERSIVELGAALDAGEVTSRQLVTGYLARIAAYDTRGPGLNAMVLLADDVLMVADARDAERAQGQGARRPREEHRSSTTAPREGHGTRLSGEELERRRE